MADKLALSGGPKTITRDEELRDARSWPSFTEEEVCAVREVLSEKGGWGGDVYGPIAAFEKDFSAYMGSKFTLPMNNGTATIHSAYFAVGVGPGDEVITSAYTWHLQVGQILALHAIPVFCDIDPISACIDPDEVRAKITPRTRAISVVHPFGAIAPMEELVEIGEEHDIPVIEDCSHAHGSTYRGRKVGTIGDIGCFSLQASKLMTGIEAGVMITDVEEYYERACLLGHYERISKLKNEKYRRLYEPEKEMAPTCFGFKYRMHPLAAAIARVQLEHLDEWTRVRRGNMCRISEGLVSAGERNNGMFQPPYDEPDTERVWLNYICLYHAQKSGVARNKFVDAVNAEGLPASGGRTGYLPVYWNPVYDEKLDIWGEGYPFSAPYVQSEVNYPRGLCPEAEVFFTRTVDLPVLHREVGGELLEEYVGAVDKVLTNIDSLR
jgi:dTDP-4-amino-4,6-dideoxygalactose transaminase